MFLVLDLVDGALGRRVLAWESGEDVGAKLVLLVGVFFADV